MNRFLHQALSTLNNFYTCIHARRRNASSVEMMQNRLIHEITISVIALSGKYYNYNFPVRLLRGNPSARTSATMQSNHNLNS